MVFDLITFHHAKLNGLLGSHRFGYGLTIQIYVGLTSDFFIYFVCFFLGGGGRGGGIDHLYTESFRKKKNWAVSIIKLQISCRLINSNQLRSTPPHVATVATAAAAATEVYNMQHNEY